VNEKRIELVLEIEQQAQAVVEAARREAEALPQLAEQEAQTLVAQAREAAEEKARRVVAQGEPVEQSQRILSQAEDAVRQAEAVALTHFDRAVAFVLARVAGRG
jgi:vacuolar-type H+-ATPase subunit E/Vma4